LEEVQKFYYRSRNIFFIRCIHPQSDIDASIKMKKKAIRGFLKDFKYAITVVIAVGAIVSLTIGATSYFVKSSYYKERQIVLDAVLEVILLAPYDGKIEDAPVHTQTVHKMMQIESLKYRK